MDEMVALADVPRKLGRFEMTVNPARPMISHRKTEMTVKRSRELGFDRARDFLRVGADGGEEALRDFAVFADQEFFEVPRHGFAHAGLRVQPAEDRLLIRRDHVRDVEERERDVVLGRAEVRDLVPVAVLLVEGVRREAEDDEPARTVLVV